MDPESIFLRSFHQLVSKSCSFRIGVKEMVPDPPLPIPLLLSGEGIGFYLHVDTREGERKRKVLVRYNRIPPPASLTPLHR